jgi:hypothetical protein
MHFTLIFEKIEGPSQFYGLVFHPCPVWFCGIDGQLSNLEDAVCIPSHRGPRYAMGDFRCLLDNAKIEGNQKIGIICHESGHGNEEDLNLLMSDIRTEGFTPQLIFRN